jgi:hypothetical protein
MMFKFELGCELKDVVTGYTGIVMARTEYFTGCKHYALQSRKLDKNSKTKEWEYFDESRLVSTGKNIKLQETVNKPPSGPMPNVPESN